MKCQDFECEHCGKKFGALVRLKNHVRQSHTQILCGLCHKQVNNRHELKRHMALEHNETKDAFVCEICPKKVFFNRLAFQKHIENKCIWVCEETQIKIDSILRLNSIWIFKSAAIYKWLNYFYCSESLDSCYSPLSFFGSRKLELWMLDLRMLELQQ